VGVVDAFPHANGPVPGLPPPPPQAAAPPQQQIPVPGGAPAAGPPQGGAFQQFMAQLGAMLNPPPGGAQAPNPVPAQAAPPNPIANPAHAHLHPNINPNPAVNPVAVPLPDDDEMDDDDDDDDAMPPLVPLPQAAPIMPQPPWLAQITNQLMTAIGAMGGPGGVGAQNGAGGAAAAAAGNPNPNAGFFAGLAPAMGGGAGGGPAAAAGGPGGPGGAIMNGNWTFAPLSFATPAHHVHSAYANPGGLARPPRGGTRAKKPLAPALVARRDALWGLYVGRAGVEREILTLWETYCPTLRSVRFEISRLCHVDWRKGDDGDWVRECTLVEY